MRGLTQRKGDAKSVSTPTKALVTAYNRLTRLRKPQNRVIPTKTYYILHIYTPLVEWSDVCVWGVVMGCGGNTR